ncbi:hypothetical protein L208DRAFT_1534640, partial [Tricholoma matsutake]
MTLLILTSDLVGIFSTSFAELHSSFFIHCCTPTFHNNCSGFNLPARDPSLAPIGGGRPYVFSYQSIASFIKRGEDRVSAAHAFCYVDHVNEVGCLNYPIDHGFVYTDLLLHNIVPHISKKMITKIAQIHKISLSSHLSKDQFIKAFDGHDCVNCNFYMSVLEVQLSPSLKKKMASANAFVNLTKSDKIAHNVKNTIKHNLKHVNGTTFPLSPTAFPPPALTEDLGETVIKDWCKASQPSQLEESGCAVCNQLTSMLQLSRLKAIKTMLGILAAPDVTRVERKSSSQKITEFNGPVLDYQCDNICDVCRQSIRIGKVPHLALAKNLWLGWVPKELSDLNFMEKLLVACICHNCCFIKIASSGLRKMVAHVIAFESPVPKVYN